MSSIRSFLQRFTLGRSYVGRDLQGNKFYEYPPAQLGSTRPKRRVKYAQRGDAYSYATGMSRLPAQWTAWLSHTRLHPPTMQELETDLARRHRVTVLAARIQAQDDEERARQFAATRLEAGAGMLDTLPGVAQQTALSLDSAPQELRAEAQRRTRMEEPQEARISSQSHQGPHAWSPNSVRDHRSR